MSEKIILKKITSSGRKVTISITGLEDDLILSPELIHRFRLVEGVVITPAQLEKLKFESEFYACDSQAARYLALRDYSAGELKTKLYRKNYSTNVIQTVIDRYQKQGIVDDNHYAYKLAQRLIEERPCGKSYLTAYLRRKKIDRELAENTADIIFKEQEESELALVSLNKRWHVFSQFELEVARKKSYNYLSRRGFGYEAAKQAFETTVNREKEVRN